MSPSPLLHHSLLKYEREGEVHMNAYGGGVTIDQLNNGIYILIVV